MQISTPYGTAYSIARTIAYVNMYEPCTTDGNLGNYKMGKAWIRPSIEQFRGEACVKVETLEYGPQFRIKNTTDSTIGKEYASKWIDVTTTDPHWYGADEATEKITVPLLVSTSLKELDLDFEVRLTSVVGQTEGFYLYEAYPYEYLDQPA